MALVMIFILIIFSTIIFSKSPLNELNLWMGIYAILSIIGTFGVLFEENNVSGTLHILKGVLDSASYYLAPHAFLMLGITFRYESKKNYSKIAFTSGIITLIPVIFLYLIYPPIPFKPNFIILSVCACSFYYIGIFLMIVSFIKEKRLIFKSQKFMVLLIVVPLVLSESIVSFVLRAFGFPNLQIINQITIIIQFSVFCVIVVKKGFMGIRIKLEGLDISMKNISTGTSIFNHTVKNEMNKISVALHTVKSSIDGSDMANEAIHIISSSVNHMKEMAEKIKNNSKKINLNKKKINILICIEQTLKNISLLTSMKNVEIFRDYDIKSEILLLGDEVYLQEVFQNIFINSLESFDSTKNPVISIGLRKNNNSIKVFISDNGKGIPNNILSKIFDPFFSTKPSKSNYGLGMTFCYNVVHKHGGIIDIESEEGNGTTIVITLPGLN